MFYKADVFPRFQHNFHLKSTKGRPFLYKVYSIKYTISSILLLFSPNICKVSYIRSDSGHHRHTALRLSLRLQYFLKNKKVSNYL